MKMHVLLDTDDRIAATSERYACSEQEIMYDFPPDFDFDQQQAYRIVDNELVHDPLPNELLVPTEGERLAAVEAALLELALGGELYG